MDPVTSALLLSWEWRVSVISVLVLAGTVYTSGWRRLRESQSGSRRGQRLFATGWRLAAYGAGLAALGLALMSPIDVLASQLFTLHMVQHMLLVMIAPPLLLLANPLAFFLWGVPPDPRRRLGKTLLSRSSVFRRRLRSLTTPALAWLAFVVVFIGWHYPGAYNASLHHNWLHDLEHVTFFGSAVLFWWHVIGAGPRIHGHFSGGARIAYVLVTIPVYMVLGAAISFAGSPIYTYYATVPRLWGLTVRQDQLLGGVIMWVAGSMMLIIAAVILVARGLRAEGVNPTCFEAEWATDDARSTIRE
jgi:putative membrane protein